MCVCVCVCVGWVRRGCSVRVLEKGVEQFRLIQGLFALSKSRRELNSLHQIRKELQQQVRQLVADLGPAYANHNHLFNYSGYIYYVHIINASTMWWWWLIGWVRSFVVHK